MRRVARFVLALLASGALLAWAAAAVVERTTRQWFEEDIVTAPGRWARRAPESARALVEGSERRPRRILTEIARDERIMATAACTDGMEMLGTRPFMPAQISCAAIGKRMAETRARTSPSRPRPAGLGMGVGPARWRRSRQRGALGAQ
jgi:hypothetical protein